MKIAIITPWSIRPNAVGGTERFVMDLANSFTKMGNAVDVYMLSGEEYTKNNINFKNVNLFNTNEIIDEYFLRKKFNDFASKDAYVNLANKIEDLVSFEEYDLIHINSQLFLKLCEDKNRIFTIHTNPFEYKLDWGNKSFETMLKLMKDESNFENTYFVTPSKHYAAEYSKLANVKIDFIPHAIDINRLINNNTINEIKEELNIEDSKKVILLPSRLEPIQKQPMLFMKAFAKLDTEEKNKFNIICTGADKQYLKYKEEIERFCEENNINILITRFNEMADAYKIADIIVLPSQSESFGYSALESLSLGKCTIINNIPTYMEVVDGSKNYYTFDNSVESLYEILTKVLNTNLQIVEQPQKWMEKYSTELFGQRYINLLKK